MVEERKLGARVSLEGLHEYERAAQSVQRSNRDIAASLGGVSGAAGQADTEIKGLGAALEEASGGLLLMGAAMAGMGAKALSFGKNLALTAARADELRLVMHIVAKNAGVTSDEIDALDETVQGLGITTEASRQMLTRLIQANMDLANATDLARAAQDLAVVVGADSSETAMRLVRAIVTGNTYLLRSLGIMETRLSIETKLAKQLGITRSQLTRAQKQQALYNLIMDQATKFSGAYEASMLNAGKRLRSMTRHVYKASVAIGEHLMPVFTKVVDAATAFFKAIYNAPVVLQKLIANIIKVTAVVGTLGGALLIKAAILPRIIKNFGLMRLAIGGVLKAILPLIGPWTLLAGAISLVVKVVRDNWDEIGPPIVKALDEMKKALEPLIQIWKNWGKLIFSEVTKVVTILVQKLVPVVQRVSASIVAFLGTWGPKLQEVGEYFTYLFRIVSDVLIGIDEFLRGNTKKAQRFLVRAWQTAVALVLTSVRNLASSLKSWGTALVGNYAAGIIAGIRKFLAPAIKAVASFISSLMAPGSAPRFLPDLGTWGAEAMQTYIDGFGQADFETLSEFTSQFRDALAGLVEAGDLDPSKFADAFFELRTTLAGLIVDFQKTGKVSGKALDIIRKKLGKVGEGLAAVIEAQLKLKTATEEVEKAQEREDEAIAAAAALYAAGEIGAEQYEDMVIAARIRGAVERKAAAEKADEAKDELDQAQALLALHQETRDVLGQQAQLIEAAIEALGKAKKEEEAAVPELEVPVPIEELDEALKEAVEKIEPLDLGKLLPDVEKAKKEVGAYFTKVFAGLKAKLQPVLTKVFAFLTPVFQGLETTWNNLLVTGEHLWSILTQAWDTVLRVAEVVWPNVQRIITTQFDLIKTQFEVVTTQILPSLTAIMAQVVGWISENWPRIERIIVPVFEAVSGAIATVVEWISGIFMDAWRTAGSWLEDNWPTIATLITDAFDAILTGIENLAPFWENTLKPAIDTVYKFIKDDVIPIFEGVYKWLQEEIPKAIETAGEFWEEVLKSSIDAVYKFIKDDVLPLWESLKTFFDVAFTVAITALAGLWQNVLQPALQVVTDYLTKDVQPVWDALKKFWDEDLKPILELLATIIGTTLKNAWEDFTDVVQWGKDNILDPLKESLKKIGDFFDQIKTAVDLVTEALRNLELPDWLTPGSPSPLEITLSKSVDLMKQLARTTVPELGRQFALSFGAPPVTAPAAAGAGAGGVGPVSYGGNTVHIDKVVISGEMSMARFEARLTRILGR